MPISEVERWTKQLAYFEREIMRADVERVTLMDALEEVARKRTNAVTEACNARNSIDELLNQIGRDALGPDEPDAH